MVILNNVRIELGSVLRRNGSESYIGI